MDLVGRDAELEFTVTEADTALAVGSGTLPVLGTPRLVAWLEAATCAAIEGQVPQGSTSVGTRVEIEHLAATAVGGRVMCRATVTMQMTRALTFAVQAHDERGTEVGRGTIHRVVVDSDRFMARLT